MRRSCRSQKGLQNERSRAKIDFDTAENERSKVSRFSPTQTIRFHILQSLRGSRAADGDDGPGRAARGAALRRGRTGAGGGRGGRGGGPERAPRAELMAGGVGSACMHQQILRGSFSAVSMPTFATKYSSFSIFRDLQRCTHFRTASNTKQNRTCWSHVFYF